MDRGEIIIYQTPDGTTNLDVRLENENIWLTQAQMVMLFDSSKANISEHVKHIYETQELEESATVRKFRTVRTEKLREISVCSKMEHVSNSARQMYQTKYHNIDVWFMQILHIPLHQTKVVVNLINQNN